MLITKFMYNNVKNISTGHTLFKLNYNYHYYIFFEDNTDLCLMSYLSNKLTKKLRDLISTSQQNLLYA